MNPLNLARLPDDAPSADRWNNHVLKTWTVNQQKRRLWWWKEQNGHLPI